jgi:phosphonate transport system substrate-binding protein
MANMDKRVNGIVPSLVISGLPITAPMDVADNLTRFLKIHLVIISLIAAVAVVLPHSAMAQDEKTILFGVVPQQAASRLAKMWDPFITRLSEETGLDIKFATMKDIPSFEGCLSQGAYDIAYMNPYHYVYYSKKAGYRAFAHQADKQLKGIIVTRIDSTHKALKDLDGKKIAFPSPAAFGASVLPRAEMKSKGINFEPVYVKSHDSVYRSVVAGFYPAGGGVKRTFNGAAEDLRSQLHIIYETNGYTPHAYAANRDLNSDKVDLILKAMMKIAKDSPELLKSIGMKGFQAATDHDWDDVRNLGLTRSQTEIVQHGELKCRLD